MMIMQNNINTVSLVVRAITTAFKAKGQEEAKEWMSLLLKDLNLSDDEVQKLIDEQLLNDQDYKNTDFSFSVFVLTFFLTFFFSKKYLSITPT